MLRFAAAIVFLVLLQACVTVATRFSVVTVVADVENGSLSETLGYWYGKLLELENEEDPRSLVTQQGSEVPLTRASIQEVLDWVVQITTMPCADGSVFELVPRTVRSINVHPWNGDLTIETSDRVPGAYLAYVFDKTDDRYTCTRVEQGFIVVTSQLKDAAKQAAVVAHRHD